MFGFLSVVFMFLSTSILLFYSWPYVNNIIKMFCRPVQLCSLWKLHLPLFAALFNYFKHQHNYNKILFLQFLPFYFKILILLLILYYVKLQYFILILTKLQINFTKLFLYITNFTFPCTLSRSFRHIINKTPFY